MASSDAFRKVTLLVFLATRFIHLAIGQEVFSIIREPKDSNSRSQQTHLDYFMPPSLECSRSGTTTGCSAYNGYYDAVKGDCQCECSFQKATFGFYSGSWTCLGNTELRNRTGCKYKFEFEYDIYPLKIVDPHETYNVILPSTGCSVESKSTRYFTCDGRWAEIDSHDWLTISCTKKPKSKCRLYELEIDSDYVDDDLLGRIINLDINCRNRGRSCLVFKLKGTLECPENVTYVTTAKPLPTTMKPTSDRIPTSTKTTTSAAAATVNATGTMTETAIDAAAIANDGGYKGKMKAKNGLSSAVVGVVVALVIIVVMVIMIVAYVYWKRKRNESVWLADHIFSHARETRSTQQKKIPEEPEYAEIPEEQRKNEPVDQSGGVYSYAFDDPQTAYTEPQHAPYNRLVHNPRGPEEEWTIYSTADDGPVYNVLERPQEGNKINLDPESTLNETTPSQTHEPEYYILEAPDK